MEVEFTPNDGQVKDYRFGRPLDDGLHRFVCVKSGLENSKAALERGEGEKPQVRLDLTTDDGAEGGVRMDYYFPCAPSWGRMNALTAFGYPEVDKTGRMRDGSKFDVGALVGLAVMGRTKMEQDSRNPGTMRPRLKELSPVKPGEPTRDYTPEPEPDETIDGPAQEETAAAQAGGDEDIPF